MSNQDMGTGWRLLPVDPEPVPFAEAVEAALDPAMLADEGGYTSERLPDREDDRFQPIDHADVLRTKSGRVAWAPPGSHDAAMAGVQQDASGHFSSVGTVEAGLHSNLSGTRI